MSVIKKIGFVLSPIVLIAILMLPDAPDLPEAGKRCLAVFAAVFILYLCESLPASIISLAVVPLLVIFNVATIKEALSGFASTSTYLIVGSFILAAAMINSRLGDRITYVILLRVGTSAKKITFAMVLVNIITAMLVPSSTARTAMMLPICLNIIRKFNQGKLEKTKFALNLLMTQCVTNSTISAGILTAAISNPMAAEFIFNATGKQVTYGEWFQWGFLPSLIMTFVSWFVIQLMFPSDTKALPNGKAYVKEQLAELGPLSLEEKKVSIIFILTIALWALGSKVGIDTTTTCLISAVVLTLPKIGILNWEDCSKNISLSVVFIASGGISLGAAMSQTGASEWLAGKIFNGLHLEQFSLTILIIILIVVVQFMHVFFVGTATMANVVYPILIGIAGVADINPLVTIVPAAMMLSGYPILMFFNTTPNILCYDTGLVGAEDFPKFGLVLSIIACAFYAFCVLFYWPMVGLL